MHAAVCLQQWDTKEKAINLCFQTTLPVFQGTEFSVTRQHEDFEWLHDTLTETEEYAGLIVSITKR